MHWAANLIGRPWAPEANCWALVRDVFRMRHGIVMPAVAIGTDANVAAICEAAHVSGWRRADGAPEEDDIVLMRDPFGRRHVGVVIRANGDIGVFHANGHMTKHGPVGSVMFQTMAEMAAAGFTDMEFWRRTCAK